MRTDWKDDIFTRRKLRLEQNSDGTVTPVDKTEYTQKGDVFGAKELNEMGGELNEIKKSVSDGKTEIAAAITLKRIATAATDTFHQMAENIKKIVLGSGNAQPEDVLQGKTATNDSGVEFTGTMPRIPAIDQASSVAVADNTVYVRISHGAHIDDTAMGCPEASVPQEAVAAAAGVNADYMLDNYNVLGVQGNIQSMGGQSVTPQTYQQVVSCAGKRMTDNIVVAGAALPPADAIKKGYQFWIGGNSVIGTFEGYIPTPNDLYYMGNNPANFVKAYSEVIFYQDHIEIPDHYYEVGIKSTNPCDFTNHGYLKIEGDFGNSSNYWRNLYIVAGSSPKINYAQSFAGLTDLTRTIVAAPIPVGLGQQTIQISMDASVWGKIYHIWLE